MSNSTWKGPTWLTRRFYKAAGWRVAYVEIYIERANIKMDAWGFADFLLFRRDRSGVVAVNACEENEINAHVAKFRLLSSAHDWLLANPDNKLVIAGWRRPERYGEEPTARFKQMKLEHFDYAEGEHCKWYPPKTRAPRVKPVASSSAPGPANTKTASTAPGTATSSRGSSRRTARTATTKSDTTLWTAAAS